MAGLLVNVQSVNKTGDPVWVNKIEEINTNTEPASWPQSWPRIGVEGGAPTQYVAAV